MTNSKYDYAPLTEEGAIKIANLIHPLLTQTIYVIQKTIEGEMTNEILIKHLNVQKVKADNLMARLQRK